MKFISNFAALFIFCFLILGCTPGGSAFISKDLMVSSPDEAGHIVGSIGFSKFGDPIFMSYHLYFRKVGTKIGGTLFISNTIFDKDASYDVRDEKLSARTFDLALPIGDYEFYQYDMSSDTGMSQTRFFARQPFSQPFSVKKGESIYLGQFLARGDWGRSLLGLKVPAAAYFEVTDQYERDMGLLSSKTPTFDPANVHREVIHAKGIAAFFLRTPAEPSAKMLSP